MQCLWRCYAAESRSHCYATWRIHVQDSSSTGHGHHHAHIARTLGRLGWRSGPGGSRPRKAVGSGDRGRSSRFTLLDGTAVAVALMCQTAEVRAAAATKNSGRKNSEQSTSNVFQPTQGEFRLFSLPQNARSRQVCVIKAPHCRRLTLYKHFYWYARCLQL